ncbi:serine hydrolase-like protein 2 isoform X7 [Myotis myotis]|uniref:Serine hydrolase like 2 n=2 Tax=Myotis myotis TaxID=51298 RepID=A0A7J7Z9Y0_MYOMY|nr:serine hydrolase-like protein 2 isoform X7 [Myotis myotis]KAF6370490.1 serine hydrolase like 2 [Myotis myotis]
MGLFSELKLAVPWGHIAAKAWGSQKGSPILCLHGWLDNANSFDRLIPLLPRDFYYVAMDFGGHGLSSHYSPGLPYYYQNFVGEIRRVSAALKWDRFSIMGHSFGGTVGGMFSCMFPEMVDKLILLDSSPFALDSNPLPRVSRMERGTPGASWKPLSGTPPVCTPPFGVTARVSQELENLLTYKRKAIEHTLLVEQAAGEPRALRPQEMLQRLLKNNSHVGEECGELLLQRGATQVPAGLVLNRDRRIAWPEHTFDFISKELCAHAIKKLQAHTLLIKATEGFFDVRREYDADKGLILFMTDQLKSALGERFQFVEIPGNHYVHMNQPDHVASIIGSFLQSRNRIPGQL